MTYVFATTPDPCQGVVERRSQFPATNLATTALEALSWMTLGFDFAGRYSRFPGRVDFFEATENVSPI